MGLALVWKPPGEGSQEFLGRFKRELGLAGKSREGIGHTGTLDPFAEGLLCVGTGEGTKLLHPLTGLSKTYRARFVFGASSDTFDSTGQVESKKIHDFDVLEAFFKGFSEAYLKAKIGAFDQVPPQFSAVHIEGRRAYDWAREGVTKELKARRCELLGARSLGFRFADPCWEWDVELTVTSGTYIRALARDWGAEIAGAPGLLSSLVRTRMGPFELPQGESRAWVGVEALRDLFDVEHLSDQAADDLKRFGRWSPNACQRPRILLNGQNLPVAWVQAPDGKIGRVFLSDPFDPH